VDAAAAVGHDISRGPTAVAENLVASVILSVSGSDRPGLTEALANAVLASGGNWLDSHLSRLGGLYVGSVLVGLEPDRFDDLRAAVRAVDAHGLDVRVVRAVAEGGAGPTGEALQLSLVGQDRPGIVRQVTGVLSGLEVNIEAFDTRISAEPHSGAPLFHMDARLRLPQGLSVDSVQAALEAISAEIMVDATLTPAP
jgi:glycine cleavage system regulatory protein